MTWPIFFESLVEAGKTTAMLLTVIIGALVLNNFINLAGLPNEIIEWVQSFDMAPMAVMISILATYVLLGMVIEGLPMIFLTVPIFVPVVQSLGFDLIWFGIVMVMVVEISLITPPIGLNVFIMKSMLPDVPLTTIFRGIIPFFIADICRLLLVVFFPPIALFLPALLY